MKRRVVITGLGIVSPLGNTPELFYDNLIAGKSGIRRMTSEFVEKLDTKIAAYADFNPQDHFTRHQYSALDRVSQFSLYAAQQAIADAKLDMENIDRTRTGVYLGTGMGGANSIEEGYVRLYRDGAERLKPFTVLMAMNNAACSQIGLEYKLSGPNLTFSTACSSSAVAIGEAMRQIRHGYTDVMLAGGSEALLTFGTIKAWEALRTLAKEDANDPGASCKPFAADRTGLVLGEGAAVLILEDYEYAKARGANIYAEISGYGTANDGVHITSPTPEGQAVAIRAALKDAELNPKDIGYINAHGTATTMNDISETAAIRQVFGEFANQTPVSSTKSMHGHLMGAAAAVEIVATTLALQHQILPPTINLHQPDEKCDLDYIPNVARKNVSVIHAMSNSFAFGGTGAVLILSKESH
ncbi:beta-ketoacyl-[acyl-carrier-protein] synthase family protein [Methyloradius palustris]|uniref:3-oxoacyl-[acyl-carrier-protein] synthase 2 n=1 Tax=Methyloradius palustris TaxID=2778876 RepID=A0A8D5G1I0_9PROT|nr:beta-ketoacyl-[acyl-carrier-protein] synthase family protein [Methyloradius palustris]BCM26132.1 3-oxoacyl-ACP synthase II [Methyloradius palustris]